MTGRRRLVPDGSALVVSGFDPAGSGRGGIFSWDGWRLAVVDRRCTTGLRMHGNALVRCLWNAGRRHADLVVINPAGATWWSRVDGVGNPHDVLGMGEQVAVVATEQNEVAWFGPDGSRTRTWRPDGEPDSWHLNSLVEHDGHILVCAFGRFTRRKEWDALGRPRSGCVIDIDTGDVVLDRLHAPHTPRFVDGRWLVCNSADGELVAVGATGEQTVLARFDGWPRGLVVTPDVVFVGVSPPRHALGGEAATSRVVALDRTSWRVLGETVVPAREVYDLELVPCDLLAVVAQSADEESVLSPYQTASGF